MTLWKLRDKASRKTTLPVASGGPGARPAARAKRDEADLKWSGGQAGI